MHTDLNFTIELTKKDIMKARLYLYFRSGKGVLLFAGGVISTAMAASIDMESFFVWFPALFGTVVIPLSVALGGINSQAIKKILEPLKYEFSDKGFRFLSTWMTAHLGWEEIRRAYESSQYFILTTPGALQILPKRDIPEDGFASFRALLRKKLDQKARLKALD